MKAISLWQPWATLVAIGAKRIETRSWDANYTGPLAIHAALKWNGELAALCHKEPFKTALEAAEEFPGAYQYPPRGVVVAVCDIDGVFEIGRKEIWPGDSVSDVGIPPPEPELSFGDYTPGRFAWVLSNIRPLVCPFQWRGSQRWFDVPDKLINAQLGAELEAPDTH